MLGKNFGKRDTGRQKNNNKKTKKKPADILKKTALLRRLTEQKTIGVTLCSYTTSMSYLNILLKLMIKKKTLLELQMIC